VAYEDRVVRVEHIDDLQESSAAPLPLDQELVVADLLRERRLGLADNCFCFFPIDAMLGNVVSVPIDPPKLHGLLLAVIIPRRAKPWNKCKRPAS
jgi:hypothetical protein